MKYCNNCKALRKSWAERLDNYKDYSNDKCWECNKYELVSKADRIPNFSYLNREEVRKSIREVEEGKRSGISYQSHGDYTNETLEYDKDGNYSYRERIERPRVQSYLQVQENKNICTKTEQKQTSSNVEYKRPLSPCRIS